MNFTGLDYDDVTSVGHALQRQADAIDRLIKDLDALVRNAPWHGHTADQFKGHWWPDKRVRLTTASTRLRGLGQSALNNATDQQRASAASGALTSPSAGGGHAGATPVHTEPVAPRPGDANGQLQPSADGPTSHAGYDTYHTPGYDYGPGGQSNYECTAWANFRLHELGYNGPPIGGDGWKMAANAGPTSHTPSLGAIASYTRDGAAPGHVVIVEGVSTDANGVTHIVVSEGNTSGSEQVSDWGNRGEMVQNPDGYWKWISRAGKAQNDSVGVIDFAKFP